MAATALRSAKLGGKNTWRAYSMADAVLIRQWEQSHYDVRKAFDQKELELHYQPKIEVATGAICGVEALLRWKSEHGYRAPGPLIEAAEQSGFIVTLGSWIVATAAQQANAWFEEGLSLPIAVNISAKQLSTPGFLEMVHTLVWQNPRLPKQLEFELTETAFEDDFPRVEKVITELAAMGFEIHLDDFGTGYSSLSRMYQFPVHTLKIDRMFTAQLQDNDRVRGMVEGLLLMCRSIGVKVVAEGVEEPEQLDFLRRMGCEQAQGYLFSKAIPARDFVSFLAAHRNSLLQAA
jgi:cyclic di-GMP phosphodiesterase Gmr